MLFMDSEVDGIVLNITDHNYTFPQDVRDKLNIRDARRNGVFDSCAAGNYELGLFQYTAGDPTTYTLFGVQLDNSRGGANVISAEDAVTMVSCLEQDGDFLL